MDAKVPEANLVAYINNGLSKKFLYIAINIRHWDPLVSFWDARSILICEEQQMIHDEQHGTSITHTNRSSSPNAITVQSSIQSLNNNNNGGGRLAYRGGRGGRNNCGGWGGGRYGGRFHNTNNGSNSSGGTFLGNQQRGTGGAWAYGWFQVHWPTNGSIQQGIM
ncbi:glycine-rich RNA-binding, abscisic acid-inducible protein-like [Lactuca sativa]|uniref:glycine-rich RNA-binding, abscisic acid-inducible protein-like n=1 Tax=Lactuca sativa TaxID=4236 RepID=UPI000CD9075B|nr:glycine-rich RNA-binding, abscisic acid-inducible protein-like [Lactuca sativa]